MNSAAHSANPRGIVLRLVFIAIPFAQVFFGAVLICKVPMSEVCASCGDRSLNGRLACVHV
jgi:hypothetical protein